MQSRTSRPPMKWFHLVPDIDLRSLVESGTDACATSGRDDNPVPARTPPNAHCAPGRLLAARH